MGTKEDSRRCLMTLKISARNSGFCIWRTMFCLIVRIGDKLFNRHQSRKYQDALYSDDEKIARPAHECIYDPERLAWLEPAPRCAHHRAAGSR
ncbi:MAG: hypothetical protein ACLT76_06500 [Clostridium fessum]